MTLVYEPGSTPVHRLDPRRSKLLVQATFVAAAFVYTTLRGLLALTALVAGMLAFARTSPARSPREFRFVLSVPIDAPLIEGATLGAPWFVVADAVPPALAGYRVVLVLFVTAAYVRTTPVRASRAAIQRTVPGRAGQFLGMGAAFVFRFLPVLQDDVVQFGRPRRRVSAPSARSPNRCDSSWRGAQPRLPAGRHVRARATGPLFRVEPDATRVAPELLRRTGASARGRPPRRGRLRRYINGPAINSLAV